MHDIKWIRENPEAFDAGLIRRGQPPSAQQLIEIDEQRRVAIGHMEKALARRNAASKEIGEAKRKKDEAHAEDLMIEVTQLKTIIPELEKTPRELEAKLNGILASIPNLPFPAPEVPDGVDEHSNVQRHIFGAKRNYAFTPKPHDDLGTALGYMDFESAAKLSGARFVVLKKGLARLERAIGQFMLDLHTGEHGYTEVNPPLLVKSSTMFGTAQLPKFESDQYYATSLAPYEPKPSLLAAAIDDFTGWSEGNAQSEVEVLKAIRSMNADDMVRHKSEVVSFIERTMAMGLGYKQDLLRVSQAYSEISADRRWLIPTAEVSLTNLVRESIVDDKELPMRLTALTPCFRAEAGAAGRDTRGMIRQHQFTKVELVSITTPETSRDEHERMLACAEEVLRQLDLHYRVMTLCAGDMGFSAQKTYDIEVWMPGQGDGGAYREISSCSVCGDFQARRMDARYRGPDGKPRFVHTLNGSGTAVGRALIAVMETYQQQDGSIAVPDVLQPYMGGLKVIACEV
jgi:seryl-tRNA synthetase